MAIAKTLGLSTDVTITDLYNYMCRLCGVVNYSYSFHLRHAM